MPKPLAEFAANSPAPGDTAAGRIVAGKIAELLERQGIPLDEIGQIQRVNAWQGMYKDDEGKAQVVDMVGLSLTPRWAEGPAWPVVQQAAPVKLNVRALKPRPLDGWRRAFVFPDTQIGYRQLRSPSTGESYLDAFHDVAAISCAMAVLRAVKPDTVIFLGDALDLPVQSKYVQEPSFAATTYDAISYFYRLLAEIRELLPDAEIVVLEGNHDLRLPRSIMVNAGWAFGLTRADMPAEWPVMSVPHLCRFAELGVKYVEGYPANEYWVNDNLVCIHGSKIGNATKSASSRVVEDERVSTIFGHIHTVEMRQKTRRVRAGQRVNFAASPGALCRIDGAVPSVKGGIDSWGRPLVEWENWQQGCAVVTFEPGDGRFNYEQVSIFDGQAVYRDRHYGPIAEDTGTAISGRA